uniref:Uncharacterized protein n=1 Tax=Denticeps clupeoides TaxID=299321 RepID=A0AAY4DPR3_9TELE
MVMSEKPAGGHGLHSTDRLVREGYQMAYDYVNYVTAKPGFPPPPAPCPAAAALRHAGDELLAPCSTLVAILDEHFAPTSRGRRRDLAWSAVLSVYVLAGQMALHCHNSGMEAVLPQIQECVGGYVESDMPRKTNLEGEVKKVCCWTSLQHSHLFLMEEKRLTFCPQCYTPGCR